MGKNRIIFLVIIGIFICFATSSFNTFASTKEELDKALEDMGQIQQELDSVNDDLSGLSDTQKTLKIRLNGLQSDLEEVVSELDLLEEELRNKEEEITVTGDKLVAAQAEEDEQYDAMKIRIQFMYEQGDSGYLDMIFSGHSFTQMLNKAVYVEKLSAYDRQKLDEYQEVVASVQEIKLALESEKEELLATQEKVLAKQDEAAKLVSNATDEVSSKQNEIDAVALEAAAKEKELKQQQQTVTELRKQYEAELALSQLAQNSYKRDISEVVFAEGDLKLMASIIYCEAGGEPYAGQLAVGSVIINRLLSSRYPDTLVGVIYQYKQFSPVGSGRLEIALTQNKATASCYQAATEAMSGVTNVGGCLYFRTPIAGVTPAYVIGGHIFY